jgi:hypothetical protein
VEALSSKTRTEEKKKEFKDAECLGLGDALDIVNTIKLCFSRWTMLLDRH